MHGNVSEVGKLVVKIDTASGKNDKTIAFTNTESRPCSHQPYYLLWGNILTKFTMMICDHCFSKILQGRDEVKQELHELTEMEGETVQIKEIACSCLFSFCHKFVIIELKKKEMCIA